MTLMAAHQLFLNDFLRRTAVREHAEIVAIAILQTHVHVLVRSGPQIDLSRLMQLMKGGSSHGAVQYLESQERHHPGEGVRR